MLQLALRVMVVNDTVEDLLVALKRAGKITKQEVAILSVNYLREQTKCLTRLMILSKSVVT